MCSWVRPSIAAIVNIGPVHLERVGSLDGIVAAKSEIAADAGTVVLNVSAHGLAALADRLAGGGKRVVRVATDHEIDADVDVVVERDGDDLVVSAPGVAHRVTSAAQPANLASALGLVLAVGMRIEDVLDRLASLPQPEHRQELARNDKGVVVIDNTFSSNPASARSSLELLARHAPRGGRAVVVTPGMIELGRSQFDENRELAVLVDDVATDLVIVGLTNRKALVAGAARRDVEVHLAATRDEAVQWVRATLTDGDVVLYENDLPDHYP
jgi:UDP-N-acetylmuramoyl-tripeptide--D-alanyl-D-alanine ligase